MSRQPAKRPSPEVMRQLLDYDPMTGILTWKPRGIEWFKGPRASTHMRRWNVLYAGKEAFTSCDAAGYRQGSILKYRTKALGLSWRWSMGSGRIKETTSTVFEMIIG